MADSNNGIDVPIHVQTTGDGGKAGADGIKAVKEQTAAATPVIRDYASAQQDAAKAEEERTVAAAKFAATQKEWQDNGNQGGSGLASDPGTFKDTSAPAADAAALAAEERRASLAAQRLIIMDMEVEAIEKEAAGELLVSQQLRAQIAERELALQLQMRGVQTEAEAVAMAQRQLAAEQMVTAQNEAQVALNNQQIAQQAELGAAEKARAASGRLAGEKGRVGAMAQNIGFDATTATNIGITVLAAQQLVTIVHDVAKSFDEARIASAKQTQELEQQASAWSAMAGMAQNLQDVSKLESEMTAKIVEMQEKLALMPNVAGGSLDFVMDKMKGTTRAMREWMGVMSDATPVGAMTKWIEGLTGTETSTEKAKRKAQEYIDTLIDMDEESRKFAKDSADQWKEFAAAPVAQRLDNINEKLVNLGEQQQAVNRHTINGGREWIRLQGLIDQANKALQMTDKEVAKVADSSAKMADKMRDAAEKAIPDGERLAHLRDRVDELKSQLGGLGLVMDDPLDALRMMEGLTDEQKNLVLEVAIEWQNVNTEIEKTTESIAKQGAEIEKNMAAESKAWLEKKHQRDEALEAAHAEQEVLAAKLTGNKAIVKEVESQLAYEKEIAALKGKGLTEREAEAEARKTKELRDQVTAREQERKISEMNADLEVETAKQHGTPKGQLDAETTALRLKKQHEAEDAGMSPEDARKYADDAGKNFRDAERKARGIIDGAATPSPRDQMGPNTDAEWAKKFGPKSKGEVPGLGPGNYNPSDDFKKLKPLVPPAAPVNPAAPVEPPKEPEVFGPPAPDGEPGQGGDNAGEAVKAGAEAVKDGADKIQAAGDALQAAGDEISAAGDTAQDAADAVSSAAAAMAAAYAQVQSDMKNLESQISNNRSFSST